MDKSILRLNQQSSTLFLYTPKYWGTNQLIREPMLSSDSQKLRCTSCFELHCACPQLWPKVVRRVVLHLSQYEPSICIFNLFNSCSIVITMAMVMRLILKWLLSKPVCSISKIYVRLIIGSINDYCFCLFFFFSFYTIVALKWHELKKVVIILVVIWKASFPFLAQKLFTWTKFYF